MPPWLKPATKTRAESALYASTASSMKCATCVQPTLASLASITGPCAVNVTRNQANELASEFLEFAQSPEARDLIERHGFVSTLPEESPP